MLGFEIAWYDQGGDIGAVSFGETAIFFRQSDEPAGPSVFWVFSEDVDGTYAALKDRGAGISKPPEDTPWGMRQFTVQDAYGNQFNIFHDR